MTTFDAARVNRACHRFVDALLAAEHRIGFQRRLELWGAPEDPDDEDTQEWSRARVRELTAVAEEAARFGVKVMVTARHDNRLRRRRAAAKGKAR